MSCAVEGCDRDVRSRFAELCDAHYFRLRRTGSTGSSDIWDRRVRKCSVEECTRRAVARGMCQRHDRRVQKGGRPDYVTVLRGAENPEWRGRNIRYATAHQRVYRDRGPAKDQICACGAQAKHWAYDHEDPEEIHGVVQGREVVYSGDPSHYVARCVPCHKRFDLGRR